MRRSKPHTDFMLYSAFLLKKDIKDFPAKEIIFFFKKISKIGEKNVTVCMSSPLVTFKIIKQ